MKMDCNSYSANMQFVESYFNASGGYYQDIVIYGKNYILK